MRTRRLPSSSDPVSSKHRTVLLHEAIDSLDIQTADTVVDATLGGAGHSRLIAERLGKKGTLVGIDADSAALARGAEALAGAAPKVHLVHGNFRHLQELLGEIGITHISKIVFDLGWSAYQLDAGRGFSFLTDGPLGMTYDSEPGEHTLTASRIVNTWDESSIADVLYGWGEERYSRRIAAAIVARRTQTPFQTSRDLAEVVKASVPTSYRYGRIHPATKTFQALRIAVNDELGALKEALSAAWAMLEQEGRMAVISFHSIEDREVKRWMRGQDSSTAHILTKKPIVPSEQELQENPRARSAKLRVIEKSISDI